MAQIEIDIEELAKAKKRVWVKATSGRKGHYREQKVGEGEDKMKPSGMKLANTIEMGDFVDFGIYGKLYVLEDRGDRFWVTDEKSERNNPGASGWYVNKHAVERIIEGGIDDVDVDEEGNLRGVDYFKPISESQQNILFGRK